MKMKRLFLTLALGCVSLAAYGQGITIPNLPSASALSGPEQIPAVQSGTAVKMTPSQIQSFLEDSANTWTKAQTFSSIPGPNVTVTDGTTSGGFDVDGYANGYFELGSYSNSSLSLFTDGNQREIISPGGNVTINAPSAGGSLTIVSNGANNLINFQQQGDAGSIGELGFDASGNMYLYSQSSGSADFGNVSSGSTSLVTNNQTRLSINSSGNVTIGAPTSGSSLSVSGSPQGNTAAIFVSSSAGNAGLDITSPASTGQSFGASIRAGTNSSDYAIGITNAAATSTLFEVLGNGSVLIPQIPSGGGVTGYLCWSSNTSQITYDTSAACSVSSERFKTNIKTLNWALGEVEALRSVSYTLKPQDDPQYHGKKAQLGFLAEDVAKVDPRLVEYDKDGKPLTVIYDRVTVLLVKALQEEHRHVLELAAALAVAFLWLAWLTWRLHALRRERLG